MGDLSPHFSRREFACKCGCPVTIVDPHLVEHLEELRRVLARPIDIVSGYRCASHNRRVKGARRSQHLVGRAADIQRSLKVSLDTARTVGFTGVGLSRGTVTHVDVRSPPGAVWRY